MSKGLHCSKCRRPTKELYSPEWTCGPCTKPEIRKLYPDWRPEREKGKQPIHVEA